MFKSSVKSITSSTILTLLIGCSSTETNKNIVYKVGGDSIILNKYCIKGVIIEVNTDSLCKKKLNEITSKNIGKPLISYFDGKVISQPAIIHSALNPTHYYQPVNDETTVMEIIKAYSK
ncbi:hypothetical protein ACMFDE_31135 (plasmid) [Escherichia coli]